MSTISCMVKNRTVIPRGWETDLLNTITFGELFQTVATEYKENPVIAEIRTLVGEKRATKFCASALKSKVFSP